jgi:hypothetical protein
MNYSKIALYTLMSCALVGVSATGCSDDDDDTGPTAGSAGAKAGGGEGGEGGTAGSTSGSNTGGSVGGTVGGSVGGNGPAGGVGNGGDDTGGTSSAGEGGSEAGAGGSAGSDEGGAGGGGGGGAGGEGGGTFEACAPPLTKPSGVPDIIKVKDESVLVAVYGAVGTQTYTCTATGVGEATTYAWSATSVPAATLRNAACDIVGTHYAGPHWESSDGSIIKGTPVNNTASASPASIKQLVLSAVPDGGVVGVLSPVTAIQRLDTVGGVAPADGCALATVSTTVAVPYTANYYFYSGADIIPVVVP